MEHTYKKLVKGIQNYFTQHGKKHAVIGLSGGIDSCVTFKLAIDALGAENITVLLMPEMGVTREENMMHAKGLCEFFGVKYHTISINKFLLDYGTLNWKPSAVAMMNTKARIRMTILYNFANTAGGLVLGTSNKTEILLGYGTKHGDFAADIEVIGDLYKEDVYKLAEFLQMPQEIIDKAPSADLSVGQTDEEDLGATYHDIDQVLKKRQQGADYLIEHGMKVGVINMVLRRIEENKHKTEPTHVIKVSKTTEESGKKLRPTKSKETPQEEKPEPIIIIEEIEEVIELTPVSPNQDTLF